jgi:hypothetical protein
MCVMRGGGYMCVLYSSFALSIVLGGYMCVI